MKLIKASSKSIVSDKEFNEQYENFVLRPMSKKLRSLLLDSSLITQTNLQNGVEKPYNIKIIDLGDYKQFYIFKGRKIVKNNEYETFDENYLFKEKNLERKKEKKFIEYKNVNRSKFSMQRIIKANENEFKTFVTLTFDDKKEKLKDININEIKDTQKKFNIWRTYIKRLFPDFKYVCVPEFQKRGAVHYHLLTNIEYDSFLLSEKEIEIYNKKSGWQRGKNIKGWSYGYSLVKAMKDINVVGYLSKYMTKDIDNRLFGQRRYYYSTNLYIPKEYFLDISDFKDQEIFINFMKDTSIVYESKYKTPIGEDIAFMEVKKCLN